MYTPEVSKDLWIGNECLWFQKEGNIYVDCRHRVVDVSCEEGGTFGMCVGTWHKKVDHGKVKWYMFRDLLRF